LLPHHGINVSTKLATIEPAIVIGFQVLTIFCILSFARVRRATSVPGVTDDPHCLVGLGFERVAVGGALFAEDRPSRVVLGVIQGQMVSS
jgi:hypothetical protein